jgi:hypothetical protein
MKFFAPDSNDPQAAERFYQAMAKHIQAPGDGQRNLEAPMGT